jgi:hypothetical protein
MKKYIPYIILAALVGAGVLAQKLFNAPSQSPATVTVSPIVQIATETPTDASPTAQCAYTWAYHSSEELGIMIDEGMRDLNAATSGNASFYGEDCTYADGTSTFSAMETDFYVRIPVADLTNEDTFGEWISQVLRLVLEFPPEFIQGKYGFVEFWFEKSAEEHVIVRVPIQEYMDGTHGITGAALFRMFYVEP